MSTYYEILLRTRAGLQRPRDAIEELASGFERGRRAGGDASIRSFGGTWARRVYWGGVAISLAMDVAIRDATGGKRTLEHALRHLAPRLTPEKRWTAREVTRAIDAWLGAPVVGPVVDRLADHRGWPQADVARLVRCLGVRFHGTAVQWVDDPAGRALRERLSSGR